MKITVTVEVGIKEKYCWLCDYKRSGGDYCELFRERLNRVNMTLVSGGDCKRCGACLEAERQPELFDRNLP